MIHRKKFHRFLHRLGARSNGLDAYVFFGIPDALLSFGLQKNFIFLLSSVGRQPPITEFNIFHWHLIHFEWKNSKNDAREDGR